GPRAAAPARLGPSRPAPVTPRLPEPGSADRMPAAASVAATGSGGDPTEGPAGETGSVTGARVAGGTAGPRPLTAPADATSPAPSSAGPSSAAGQALPLPVAPTSAV